MHCREIVVVHKEARDLHSESPVKLCFISFGKGVWGRPSCDHVYKNYKQAHYNYYCQYDNKGENRVRAMSWVTPGTIQCFTLSPTYSRLAIGSLRSSFILYMVGPFRRLECISIIKTLRVLRPAKTTQTWRTSTFSVSLGCNFVGILWP